MSAARSVGTGARLAIFAQVTLTVILALAATLLVNWLAGRPGIRRRFDLTATAQNTLSTAAVGVLERLEEPVAIDVFYRGLEGPLARLGRDTMDRTFRLLLLMGQEADGRLEIHNNDLADREGFDQRRRELKVTGFENCLIVSRGERREILRLSGDLAVFDPGRPKELGYRPPRILEFRAEAAIIQGILQVTRGEVPHLYFSTGHGERDLYAIDDDDQLGQLQRALVDDGFETSTWQFESDGPVPDDCAALAIIGPVTAFDETEFEAIRNYVDGGGRLVLAPPRKPKELERSSVSELLDVYGLEISRGTVMRPFIDATGMATQGGRINAYHRIPPGGMARHVITDPLRDGGRVIVLVFTRELRVKKGGQPRSGTSLPLLRTGVASWLDLVPNDFLHDPDSEELRPFEVCYVSVFVPPSRPETVGALEERPESRIFAIGTADVFTNRLFDMNADFLRNAFNWVASREYRVSISSRNPDLRILPLGATDALAKLTRLALWGLPGLCLLLGIFTAWRRSAGGPGKASRRSAAGQGARA